jgi:AraC-like DNA-binding protein
MEGRAPERIESARFARATEPRTAFWNGARYLSVPACSGAEIVHVTNARIRWCEFHETFTVCNALDGGPIPWHARGRSYIRATNRLMVIGPGEIHADVGMAGPMSFQILRVPPHVVYEVAEACGLSRLSLGAREVLEHESIRVFTELHRCIANCGARASVESLWRRAIHELARICARPAPDADDAAEHVVIRRSRQYIEGNLGEDVSMAEVARFARTDRFQLSRYFRRALGMAPYQYLIHRRAARARVLLAEGHSCTEVAQKAGFYDQSHLIRWFTRVYGLSPGQYQRTRLFHVPRGGL